MERLGPTVDRYVEMLVAENQKLRKQRDTARKILWDVRQQRNRWRTEAISLRRRPTKNALYTAAHRERQKAA